MTPTKTRMGYLASNVVADFLRGGGIGFLWAKVYNGFFNRKGLVYGFEPGFGMDDEEIIAQFPSWPTTSMPLMGIYHSSL